MRLSCAATASPINRTWTFTKLGVKYILTRTAGTDHIDKEYAKELGFPMAFVPRYSPNAIAELAVTQAMMLLRHTAYTTSRTAKKNFKVDAFMFSKEVRNCTVGVVGLGRIGRVAAQIFHGMGATVIGEDVFEIKGIEDYCTQVSLDEVLENPTSSPSMLRTSKKTALWLPAIS